MLIAGQMYIYETLGVEPGEVVRGESVEHVAETVARADDMGKAVVIWGGGTAQTYGHLPRRADILLDISGLRRVIAHEFADLTMTVQAGATLADVQNALALHNQFLPLDPLNAMQATIGGIIATNALGPGVLGYGMVRDWLLGITVVDALGRQVKGGGKVVKNVTGYDIPKIHIGALGTLGVVVEATFKVAPRPEAIQLVIFTCVNAAFSEALHNKTSPAMSVIRATPFGAVLAVIYSGMAAVVESEALAASTIARDCGEVSMSSLPGAMPPPFSDTVPPSPLVLRFFGTRSGCPERHNAIADLCDWQLVDTFPGTGQTTVYLDPRADPEKALQHCLDWASRQKIAIAVLHAPASLRRSDHTLWQPLPPALPLMRRLKATLDPNNTLNPGRFIGDI